MLGDCIVASVNGHINALSAGAETLKQCTSFPLRLNTSPCATVNHRWEWEQIVAVNLCHVLNKCFYNSGRDKSFSPAFLFFFVLFLFFLSCRSTFPAPCVSPSREECWCFEQKPINHKEAIDAISEAQVFQCCNILGECFNKPKGHSSNNVETHWYVET